MNLGSGLESGLYVTIVGMGLVFFSLAVLMIAMMLLDRVFPGRLVAVGEDSSLGAPAPVAAPAAIPAPAAPRADGPFEAVVGEKKHRVELKDVASQTMVVVVDGQEHRVQRSNGNLAVDGREYAASVVGSGAGYVSVKVGDEVFKVAVPTAAPAQALGVDIRGAASIGIVGAVSAPAALAAAPAGSGAGVTVPAPLPGRIIKVTAAVGQSVAKGDELLVIEAMKMENSIRAPQDGVVREVRVQQGQTVAPGQVLVVL